MAKSSELGTKHWLIIIFFIFIGVIILSFFWSNDNSDVNDSTKEAKKYQLGDEILAGDFKWKIIKVSTAEEIGGSFLNEKADGIFVIIDVEVENIANSAEYLSNSDIILVDNQGREFSPSSVAIYLKPAGSALIFEQINPGIIKKGKIVYDVPDGINNFNVKIKSNLFEDNIYNLEITI